MLLLPVALKGGVAAKSPDVSFNLRLELSDQPEGASGDRLKAARSHPLERLSFFRGKEAGLLPSDTSLGRILPHSSGPKADHAKALCGAQGTTP